jgi:hypothetical protein
VLERGRIEAAVRYSDDGQLVITSGRHEVPYGTEGGLGAAYVAIGQPERCVEWLPRAPRTRSRHSWIHEGIPRNRISNSRIR